MLWPLWGAAAGALGAFGHAVMQPFTTPAQRGSGLAVLGVLDRALYHAGSVAGFLAIICLLVVTAGWWRWIERETPGDLVARMLPLAFLASAASMIFGYGVKGNLAIYLRGGINQTDLPPEGLYVLYIIDDLAAFIAWWGVAVGAGAVALLSLRDGLLPRWIGAMSALVFLAPFGFLVLTGLTGFSGVVGPLWLIALGIGLALRKRAT